MAIYIHCPQCHQRLQEMREDCAHCGAVLPPGVFHALAAALGASPPAPTMPPGWAPRHVTPTTSVASPPPGLPSPPVQHSPLRPWLAAALSLFCGLGQLYNGQVVKGIVLLVLGAAALLSLQLSLGKIMVPLLWMYAIVDAYMVARRTSP
jgi:TM2 domain-containing membrane protein YozV